MAITTAKTRALLPRVTRGEVVRILMYMRGFSQHDVAMRGNIHRSTVNLLLNDSPQVSDALAERVADGLNCIPGRLTRFARNADAES